MTQRDLERGPQGDHGQAGPQGSPGRPGRDLSWTHSWPRLLAYILVVAAAVYSTARTHDIAAKNKTTIERVEANQRSINAEGAERRDQICLSAEREHLRDIRNLKDTYLYLANLNEDDQRTSLNRFILAQLPQKEDTARLDVAPEFCDQPGVGLPEPDPRFPNRPEKVDKMVLDIASEELAFRDTQDLRNPDTR